MKAPRPWHGVSSADQERLNKKLEAHEAQNPTIVIRDLAGTVIPDETPLETLAIPGGVEEIDHHPDAIETQPEAA